MPTALYVLWHSLPPDMIKSGIQSHYAGRRPSLGAIYGWAPFASLTLFSIFANLLMLTGPLYMLQIYDRVLASGSISTLWALTILAVASLGAMASIEAVRSSLLQRLAVKFDASLGQPVFAAAFTAHFSGETRVSRYFTDIEAIRHFLSGQGMVALFDAPWAPLYLALIFMFHPWLGMVATGGALILFSLTYLNELISSRIQRRGSAAVSQANGFAESALRCAQAAGAMGMIPSLGRRWLQQQIDALSLVTRAGERTSLIQAVSRAVRQSLQIAMLGTGAALVLDKSITAGVMVVGSIIMGRALSPVEQLIGQWRSFESARTGWRRVSALIGSVPAEQSKIQLPAVTGAIEVDNLTCVPPGSRNPVIKSISFNLAPGEVLAVIGPSGAGKSSLIRVLTGIWQPLAGTVKYDGARWIDFDSETLGKFVGYLPQEVELLDGTIAENIGRFSHDADEAEIVRAAQQAGVHELILSLPDGYQTKLTNGGAALSGGERQRIGLARALYGNPSIVILDEPSSNLDQEGEHALMRAIAACKASGKTVILVAHRPSLLENVDHVLVLSSGVAQAFGAKDEIIPRVTAPSSGSERPREQRLALVGE